ncbi:MAG: hypothetical protein N2383_07220 [Caldilineales bacterium]|nr:hypothetical protein [Caldilineales bacterium]
MVMGYAIKSHSPHRGVDVAIECSGHYPALHEAMCSVHQAGLVVAVRFYQGGGTALRPDEEWHHNRLTLAHDWIEREPAAVLKMALWFTDSRSRHVFSVSTCGPRLGRRTEDGDFRPASFVVRPKRERKQSRRTNEGSRRPRLPFARF